MLATRHLVTTPENFALIMERGRVSWGGATLDLSRRPVCARLFEIFAEQPDRGWSKPDLLLKLYPSIGRITVSKRMLRSLDHNLVKMISRARTLAQRYLAKDTMVDWFYYDLRREQWFLMRPSMQAYECLRVSR